LDELGASGHADARRPGRPSDVPKLSEFFGIEIRMYWTDHGPPHFHAVYAGQEAQISIELLTVIEGRLPPRVLGLVLEWAMLHQQELREAWRKVSDREPPGRIEPLT
jgi:hypothetical protein